MGKETLEKTVNQSPRNVGMEIPAVSNEKVLLIKPVVEQFLNNYVKSKQEPFAGHAIGTYIRRSAPEALYKTGLVDRQNYSIEGSVGKGS